MTDTKAGRGQTLPIPVSYSVPQKLTPMSVSNLHEKLVPTLGWTHVEVPYSRAEGKSEGQRRAEWCAENFGPSAVQWHNEMDATITFDHNAAWFGHGNSIQHFYFKNSEHAVLFRVCKG